MEGMIQYMRNFFIVSGYGAAGKSTVINSIANSLDVTTIPFGTIHKLAYKNAGYSCTADWLAKEGYDAYENKVLELFKREIEKTKGDVLIDGLFSSSCYYYLKSLELNNNNRIINIFISTPEDERIKRMYRRQKFTTIEQSYRHTKASDFIKGTCGLYQIHDDAKYLVDGTQEPKLINMKIEAIIQSIKEHNKTDQGR